MHLFAAWIMAALTLLHGHQSAHTARTAPQRASRNASRTQPDFASLRRCESGGRYHADTGNGFFGAYQATRPTWDGYWRRHKRPDLVGRKPSLAAPADQDAFARGLYAERGGAPWPHCRRYL